MSVFCIQGGTVVLENSSVVSGTVIIRNHLIEYAGVKKKTPGGATLVDAKGKMVTPGLIECHIHGAGNSGFEAGDADTVEAIGETLFENGVLRFLPTMMASEEIALGLAAAIPQSRISRHVPGLYLEGPFISPDKRGGIQKPFVRAVDISYLKKLQRKCNGAIRLMTFAPELPAAGKLPAAMRAVGIRPCVGHSCATAKEAERVASRGIFGCTHLFNAMSGLDHRHPGLAAFVLAAKNVYTELNADGIHVAPEMIRLAARVLSPEKLILISDAVVSAGLPVGEYTYMGRDAVARDDGVFYRKEGTLVGSRCLLNQILANYLKTTGADLHVGVKAATLNPARFLGIARQTGSLASGKRADVVVFSRNFRRAEKVFFSGEKIL